MSGRLTGKTAFVTGAGQGIGLAVVADIVDSYNIELNFGRGKLGGLRASLKFHKS